jgi:hypothetical protein
MCRDQIRDPFGKTQRDYDFGIVHFFDFLFYQREQLGIYPPKFLSERFLVYLYWNPVLYDVGIIRFQILISLGKDIRIFFEKLNVFEFFLWG